MRGTTKFTIILIVSALAGVGTLVLPSYFLIQQMQVINEHESTLHKTEPLEWKWALTIA